MTKRNYLSHLRFEYCTLAFLVEYWFFSTIEQENMFWIHSVFCRYVICIQSVKIFSIKSFSIIYLLGYCPCKFNSATSHSWFLNRIWIYQHWTGISCYMLYYLDIVSIFWVFLLFIYFTAYQISENYINQQNSYEIYWKLLTWGDNLLLASDHGCWPQSLFFRWKLCIVDLLMRFPRLQKRWAAHCSFYEIG